MLSTARTKEILKNENLALTDKEAEKVRDGFDVLTEIIFEKWRRKREQERKFQDTQRSEKTISQTNNYGDENNSQN
jgi:hypothetical protein